MKFDLEEGNFCDVLLGKIIDEDDKKKNNSPGPLAPDLMKSDLDLLKKDSYELKAKQDTANIAKE